jgi:SH3 domain protein
MYRLQIIFAVVLGICMTGQWSWAEQAYVTDNLKITLRTGPSTSNKIIGMLSSGNLVDLLGSEGDWSQIRTQGAGNNAKEGWVLSRYLTTRQPAMIQIDAFRKENTRLKEQMVVLQEKVQDTDRLNNELTEKLNGTTKALDRLDLDYNELKQGSAEYLKLKEAFAIVESKLKKARQEFGLLDESYKKIKYSERNIWFATGAAILFIGVICGIALGRREKRHKPRYY